MSWFPGTQGKQGKIIFPDKELIENATMFLKSGNWCEPWRNPCLSLVPPAHMFIVFMKAKICVMLAFYVTKIKRFKFNSLQCALILF